MKKKILLSSIGTIAICLCLIAGSTFALFTTSDEVNVAVTAGKVALTANLDDSSLLTWSLYQTEDDARTDGLFDNGGTAEITDEANVVIERMTPGDVAKFMIDVENTSNVGVQYRVRMVSNAGTHEVDLTEALTITAYIDGFNYPTTGTENATVWKYIEPNAEINDIWVTVSFPNNGVVPADDYNDDGELNDNDYQEATANMSFIVEAVQGNAYDYAVANVQEDVITKTPNEVRFANDVISGEGTTVDVDSTAIRLDGNLTLADITLDGTQNPQAEYALIWEKDGVDSTMILAKDSNLIAAEDQDAIRVENTEPGETFTLIMDKDADITVSGMYGHAVLVQYRGVVNLVLNGSLDELIHLEKGAYAFGFAGGYYPGENIVVNIFVNSEADMNEYKNAIDPDSYNYIVNWYIDGTPINYTNN